MMNVEIIRLNKSAESMIGAMYLNGEFQGFTLEDPTREQKIEKVTAIPDGVYNLGLRKADSGMTKKYRAKYDWFKWHLWIQGIPGFEYVYIHVGNKTEDSDGCILLGDQPKNNVTQKGWVGNSTNTFSNFYKKVFPRLENGESATIIIRTVPLNPHAN
jgi:hypothetical protein